MHSHVDASLQVQANPTHLRITDSEGRTIVLDLEKNASLFAGAGSNCKIRLTGPDVNTIHCMLWLDEEDTLRIQDWNTGGKTKLNGQVISDEMALAVGDKLEIGSNLIEPAVVSIRDADSPDQDSVTEDLRPIQKLEHEQMERSQDCDELHETETPSASPFEPFDHSRSPADDTFVYTLDLDESNGSEDLMFQSHGSASRSCGDNELEMLRIEVEQLRYDLAERDAQIRMLSDGNSDASSEDVDNEDTVRLVTRLEELLSELRTSDDRVRELEDLLKLSDEATQAEQEERLQLESWLTEIEHRVVQRESELESENKRLSGRFKEIKSHYEETESRLQHVIESGGGGSSDALRNLTSQVTALQSQLLAAKEENDALRKQNQHDEKHAKAHEELQQMEQKLLDLQVEASRERAEFARQRVELERLKGELEQKLNSNAKMGDADTRIQAMRQHLAQIHEEEKLEREEKKQRSLSGRISRLLNRVGNQ